MKFLHRPAKAKTPGRRDAKKIMNEVTGGIDINPR